MLKNVKSHTYAIIIGMMLLNNFANPMPSKNLIMLLDKSAESILNPASGVLCPIFNAALDYGQCPIIISGVMLHAWLARTNHFNDYIRAISDTSIHPAAKNSACFNPIHESGLRLPEFKKFQTYKCVDTQEYLLIPHSLSPQSMHEAFTIDNPYILKPLTFDQLEQDLIGWDANRLSSSSYSILKKCGKFIDKVRNKLWFLFGDIQLQNLKKIFVTGSRNWIIYINGHSWYTGSRFQKKESIFPLKKEYLTDFNNLLYYPMISGLTTHDHQDLLTFFGTTLHTLAVYESTCWLGGYHLNQIIKEFKQLKNNPEFHPYHYICSSISDCGMYPGELHGYNFEQFFKNLESHYQKPASGQSQEQLKLALKAITPNPYQFKPQLSTPLYYDGFQDTAEVIDCHHMLALIKDPFAHSIVEIKDKKGVLLFSKLNDCAIYLKETNPEKLPLFISMITGDSVQVIDSLETPCSFDQVLKHSFYGFLEIAKKTFIIKNMQVKNYPHSGISSDAMLDLENVIIEKSWDIQNRGFLNTTLKISGTIYAKLKDKNQYVKANIHSAYDTKELTIGKFILITQSEFTNKMNSLIAPTLKN